MQQQQLESQQQAADGQAEKQKQADAQAAVRHNKSDSPVQQLQEAAKQYGATKAGNIGGTPEKNPINAAAEAEEQSE
jgi:hypothetical protein